MEQRRCMEQPPGLLIPKPHPIFLPVILLVMLPPSLLLGRVAL